MTHALSLFKIKFHISSLESKSNNYMNENAIDSSREDEVGR